MERRFDMTDFEQSLRDHADHFIMMPSKKVWHGIYNDLHPGSKWPSFTVAIVFLFALIGIGHFNNDSQKQLAGTNEPASEKNSNDFNLAASTNDYDLSSTFQSYSGGNLTFWKNEALLSRLEADKIDKSDFVENRIFSDHEENVADISSSSLTSSSQAAKVISLHERTVGQFNEVKPGEATKIAESVAIVPNIIEKTIGTEDAIQPINDIDISGIYPQNAMFTPIKYAAIIDDNGVATDSKTLPGKYLQDQVQPTLVRLEIANADNNQTDLADGSAALNKPVAKARRKGKIGWLYFVSPTLSTASFRGNAIAFNRGQSLSPLNLDNQNYKNMIYNPRPGYAVGIQMSYSFSDKWQLITGATFNSSGYKIVSNQVHPTFAYLMLKDNQTGGSYSKSYITHYGNGQGQNQISLSNKSLQLSIPVGLEYSLWQNENVKVSVASTVAPTAILKSNSFIMSADGRNYVSDPSLLRKFNLAGEFGSFVTLSSKKIKWHIGPNIRYQILSTYKQQYPVKEHLIDYGIKVGISK